MYEYRDKIERVRAEEHGFEQEADKIEDAKTEETLDWIEEEERKEREAAEIAKAKLDQDDKWMLEQLKKQNGEDFGEDIDLNFGE